MSRVNAKIQIDAPVQRVWETVMDPDCLRDWVTIHRAVRSVSDKPLIAGSTMEQVLRMHGVSFHVHWHVADVSPPNSADWEGRGPAHSRAHIAYRLSGPEAGPTVFEYMNEFSAPGGRLGNVASRVLVGAASEREATNSLSRLKALLEKN